MKDFRNIAWFAFVLVVSVCLLLNSGTTYAAKEWDPAPPPTPGLCTPLGNSIKVKTDDKINIISGCDGDFDSWTEGCSSGVEPDPAGTRVKHTIPQGGGTLSNSDWVTSYILVEYTAPSSTGAHTLTIEGDDIRTSGDRNDNVFTLKTLSITVVNNCPTSISLESTCTGTDPQTYTTFGFIRTKMKANPDGTNWDGYVVTEEVSLNTGLTTCTDADLHAGYPLSTFCKGVYTFTIGEAAPELSVFGCNGPATQNRFWDDHFLIKTVQVLTQGRGPCSVYCIQIYKCGGTGVGTFSIRRTLQNSGGRTLVEIEKF